MTLLFIKLYYFIIKNLNAYDMKKDEKPTATLMQSSKNSRKYPSMD